MQRCLHLAQMGEGRVAPNPMVGAVLVYNGIIIGEGFHKKWGDAHAEVACLQSVTAANQRFIEHATLYVSLEPCSHFGKTPPCVELIIRHKIPLVVVGCIDPFKAVAGSGIERVRAAGITVTTGVLEVACRRLNKHFVTFHEQQRPYIFLKWAQTADGKIAGENRKRVLISNQYTARLVHRWRSQNMAIMVGTNTALYDDPTLTTRFWPGKNAVRLVLDKLLRLPDTLHVLDGQQSSIVFNLIKHEQQPNLFYYKLKKEGNLLQQICDALFEIKIQSVMIEGGSQLVQSFIDAGLWDEAAVITNMEMVLEKGLDAPQLQQHRLIATQTVFSDAINIYAHQENRFFS